jgi:hypothetical protein
LPRGGGQSYTAKSLLQHEKIVLFFRPLTVVSGGW